MLQQAQRNKALGSVLGSKELLSAFTWDEDLTEPPRNVILMPGVPEQHKATPVHEIYAVFKEHMEG